MSPNITRNMAKHFFWGMEGKKGRGGKKTDMEFWPASRINETMEEALGESRGQEGGDVPSICLSD